MRNMMLYAVLLAVALLIPVDRVDLEKLKPVESVLLYREGEIVVVKTDTEDIGRGESVSLALENLKETTAGVIYLDTADYLLIEDRAEDLVEGVRQYLKDGVHVCQADKKVDLKEAASYLSVHRPKKRLKDWRQGDGLEKLVSENGCLNLK